jgi:hypothetical protein
LYFSNVYADGKDCDKAEHQYSLIISTKKQKLNKPSFSNLDAEDVNVSFVEEMVIHVDGVDGGLALLFVAKDLKNEV